MSSKHFGWGAPRAWMVRAGQAKAHALALALAAATALTGQAFAQAVPTPEPPPTTAPVPRLRLDKLYDDMRAYCMSEVCAGMTVAELSRIDGGQLLLDRPLIADKLCNSPQQQSINGTFIGRDGTRLDITFYMIPGAGEPQDVYRAVTIDLRLVNISEDELDGLAKRLVDRYRLSRQGDLWLGARHDLLEVSLSRGVFKLPNESVSQLKLTVAPTGPFAYVANQPWCQGDPVPPLPAPKPPLPVL